MSESTEQLVARAKQGDKSAIDGLYLEYKDRLTKFVIKQGLTEQDAEDVVSESFVEVVRGIDKLENDEYFGTWLHKIALRKANDTKRKAAAHRRVIFEENEETGLGGDMAAVEQAFEAEYGDTVMLPSDYAENEDTKRIIAEQINSLSGEHKEALVLFYYDNRSINEIAEMTGTNVNNAKARLFRARQGLKKKLEVLQKKGITLCAVPISGLLAELDEGGKGAAAAAASGESAAAASTEAAAVTTSSTAKLAALAAVAVIVVGVGFAVTKLSHLSGDYRPENSSEAVTTTATTTTTTTPSLVTTAVPEIADESADERLTVTTTTTTATTTTEAVTEAPAGGTTEAVIAPPAAEPEKELTEHDRWVKSIKEDIKLPDELEEGYPETLHFSEEYGNAYDYGCAYVMIQRHFGTNNENVYLIHTTDGGDTWDLCPGDGVYYYEQSLRPIEVEGFHIPTQGLQRNFISLDDGRCLLIVNCSAVMPNFDLDIQYFQPNPDYIIIGPDQNGNIRATDHRTEPIGETAENLIDYGFWYAGAPLSTGTLYTGYMYGTNTPWYIIPNINYLGGYRAELTLYDYSGNYIPYLINYKETHGEEAVKAEIERIDSIVLYSGTVDLDPVTLRPIFKYI